MPETATGHLDGTGEKWLLSAEHLVVGPPGPPGRPGFRARLEAVHLARGDMAVLTGDNGTGKTTALSCLAGLVPPLVGQVFVEGEPLYGILGARTRLRRKLAFVSSEPYMFRGTVLDNVSYGLRSRGMGRSEAGRLSIEALERADLTGLAGRPARSLSRGQMRRVAVIRALIVEPLVLLLDEPDGDLDGPGRTWLAETIEAVLSSCAVLLATHLSGDLVKMARHFISVDPQGGSHPV